MNNCPPNCDHRTAQCALSCYDDNEVWESRAIDRMCEDDTLPPSDGEPFDTLPPDDEDDTLPGVARTPTVPQSFRAAPIPSDVLLHVPCDPTRPGEYHMRGFEEENVGRSTFKAAPRFIPHYPAMGHNCRCDDCRAER